MSSVGDVQMSYFPNNMKYALNSLSGFTRQRVKIPLQYVSARGGDILTIRLPSSGSMIDLSTLTFAYNLSTYGSAGGGLSNGFVFPPRHSASLIQRLDISINGQSIQSITDYNVLWNMIAKYQIEDARPRQSVLEWNGNLIGYTQPSSGHAFMGDYSTTTPSASTGCPQCIKMWLGWLNSNKIYDPNVIGEVQIQITLAPNTCLAVNKFTDATYIMNNMSLQFDCVNLDSPLYYEAMRRQLEQGSLKYAFKNYIAFQGAATTLGSTPTNTFNVSTQSLDYLHGTLINTAFNTSAGNAFSLSNASSAYFNNGIGDLTGHEITGASWQIGTVTVPAFSPNLSEVWSHHCDSLQIAQDTIGQIQFRTDPVPVTEDKVTNLDVFNTYQRYNFMYSVRLCHGERSPSGPLLSGLNTAGTNTQILYRVTGNGTTATFYPYVFAETTAVMSIGQGRQISLVL